MTRAKQALQRMRRGRKILPPDALEKSSDAASTDNNPTGIAGLPLPSPIAGTNLMIANIVLRAASGLLRNRLEKGLLVASYDKAKADRLVDGRTVVMSVALWGASRIATRSPVGLALVTGGLAAKVLYDRGKQIETKRRARKQSGGPE